MSIIKVQQQDKNGNVIHQETNSSLVKVGDISLDTELDNLRLEGSPIVEATGTNSYIGSTARIKELKKGTKLTLFIENDATSNCTLNLNSYGEKSILDSNGNAVNNLKANIPYNVCYNGTNFILHGKGGGGNATADKLLSGVTATVDSGQITGTMPNNGVLNKDLALNGTYTIPEGYTSGGKITQNIASNGEPTETLNCGGSYDIVPGYYSGGKVTANSLASQTSATAIVGNILTGQTAWVNGAKLTGTMENQGAKTSALNCGGSYTIPAGYHNGSGKVTANTLASQTSANATASQILSGYTAWVNGVKLSGSASVSSLGGMRYATGTATPRWRDANGGGSTPMMIDYNIGFTPLICMVRVTKKLTFITGGNDWEIAVGEIMLYFNIGDFQYTQGIGANCSLQNKLNTNGVTVTSTSATLMLSSGSSSKTIDGITGTVSWVAIG